MDTYRSRPPLHRRWRATVERYTPDGALGRWLLGSIVGGSGLWLLALALFDGTLSLLWGVLLFALSVPTLLFAVLVLWPLYLSLIGNLESAAEYSVGDATAGTDAGSEPDGEEEPLDALKRRYANGELSEAEFERRTERLLEVDSLDPTASEPNGAADATANLERERE